MAVKTQDRVRSAIASVGEEIAAKAWKLGRDPKAERRKRIQWGILQGAIGAAFTLGARRVGARAWGSSPASGRRRRSRRR